MFTVASGTNHRYSYVDVPQTTASNTTATDSKSEYMSLQDRTKAEPGEIALKHVFFYCRENIQELLSKAH